MRDLIFISFRSIDQGWAAAVDNHLSARFGKNRVFRSSRSLQVGRPFPQAINAALQRSCVTVVLISEKWLNVTDTHGARRLNDPQDFVRQEIASSLEAGIPVIPLLINQAKMPQEDELPADLRPLVRLQNITLRNRTEAADLDEIARRIADEVPQMSHVAPAASDSATPSEQPRTEGLNAAASELAVAVADQWRREAANLGLIRPHPMDLPWWSEKRQATGTAATIVSHYCSLDRRQLVILGPAGAGKTCLAILLTLGLAQNRDDAAAVPVIFSLASWNPQHTHLTSWLIQSLDDDYRELRHRRFGHQGAAAMLKHGRIIPVLDGLDEISPNLLPAAIEAIDRAVAGGLPLVITCRTEIYESAVSRNGRSIVNADRVTVLPPPIDDVTAYLTADDPNRRWATVVDKLRADQTSPAAHALQTPLLAWLARTVHATRDPHELLAFNRRSDVERHLIANYLGEVFPDNTPPPAPGQQRLPSYRPAKLSRWVSYLAQIDYQVGGIEWWRMHRQVPRLGLATIMAAMAAVPVFTGVALVEGRLAAAVAGTLAALLTIGAAVTDNAPVRPVGFNLGRASIRAVIGKAAPRGVAVAIVVGVVAWQAAGLIPGLLGAAVSGLLGVAAGMVEVVLHPTAPLQAASPASTLRADRAASIRLVGGAGVLLGIVGGAAVAAARWKGQTTPFDDRLALAHADPLTSGLAAGAFMTLVGTVLLIGLLPGLAAWPWYLAARTWLTLQGSIPLQLWRFLDDAHRRGMLRQTGPMLQFRHRVLRDHFADARSAGRREIE